jgi:TP53 regulating kinase-like protein
MKLIAQGAEAKIFKKDKIIIKERIKKGYRFSNLDDKIRRQRTRKEARILQKASTIIPVPKVISVNEASTTLIIENILGEKLASCLDTLKNKIQISKTIGSHLAKLHDCNIIHGDLTTSNMILTPPNQLYFIDFGLGFESNRIEDKAVDLHLIREALEAKHHKDFKKCFKAVIEGYKVSKNHSSVLQRFKLVESRGRYKQAY